MGKAIQIILGLVLAIVIAFILGYAIYNTTKHLNEEKNTNKNYGKILTSLFPSVIFFNKKRKKGISWALKILFVVILSLIIVMLYYKNIHSEVFKGEKSIDKISSSINKVDKKIECNKKCSIYEGENYEECYSSCVNKKEGN